VTEALLLPLDGGAATILGSGESTAEVAFVTTEHLTRHGRSDLSTAVASLKAVAAELFERGS
jgi:hypothetical protein